MVPLSHLLLRNISTRCLFSVHDTQCAWCMCVLVLVSSRSFPSVFKLPQESNYQLLTLVKLAF